MIKQICIFQGDNVHQNTSTTKFICKWQYSNKNITCCKQMSNVSRAEFLRLMFTIEKSHNAQNSAYLHGSRYNQSQENEEKILVSRTLQTKRKTDIPKQRQSDYAFCSCGFSMNSYIYIYIFSLLTSVEIIISHFPHSSLTQNNNYI